MIADSVELKVAVRNLKIMEEALRALREQLEVSNLWLLEVTSKGYVRRIAALQTDIAQYLNEHPTEVSLILPPLEQVIAATAPKSSPTL
jgi:hypothetical protein